MLKGIELRREGNDWWRKFESAKRIMDKAEIEISWKVVQNLPRGSECFPEERSVRVAKSELYVALYPFVVAVGEDKEYLGLQLAEIVSRKSAFEFMIDTRVKNSGFKEWCSLLVALTRIERRKGKLEPTETEWMAFSTLEQWLLKSVARSFFLSFAVWQEQKNHKE